MAYTPDPADVNEPTIGRGASSAAAEFRAIKAYMKAAFGSAPFTNVFQVSVKNFQNDDGSYVTGNGITDDWTGLKRARDYFAALSAAGYGGGQLYFPPTGLGYRSSGPLDFSESGVKLVGATAKSSFILFEDAGDNLTYSDPAHLDITTGRFSIENLGIVANPGTPAATDPAARGVVCTETFDTVWKEVEIDGFAGGNLVLDQCYGNTFLNLFNFNSLTGLVVNSNCVNNIFLGGSLRLAGCAVSGPGNKIVGMDLEPIPVVSAYSFGAGAEVDCYLEAGNGLIYANWVQITSEVKFKAKVTYADSSWPTGPIISVSGDNNDIEIDSAYHEFLVRFTATSSNNKAKLKCDFTALATGTREYQNQPILDLGLGNQIEYAGASGNWTKWSGLGQNNRYTITGNFPFVNLALARAGWGVSRCTSALSADILDPFGGAIVYKSEITSTSTVTPAYARDNSGGTVGDNSQIYTQAGFIYIPTGSTLVSIMVGGTGTYPQGQLYAAADLPKDRWISFVQQGKPKAAVVCIPFIQMYGPIGAVVYDSYMTLYAGHNPGTPAVLGGTSARQITW